MAGVLTFAGDAAMLEAFLEGTRLSLHLFTNDRNPRKDDDAELYTEALGGGYVARLLTSAAWTLTPGPPAIATAGDEAFSFTGAVGPVFGYFLLDGEGRLIGAERFAGAPFDIQRAGDTVVVRPMIATVPNG